jgi:capsid portal protein
MGKEAVAKQIELVVANPAGESKQPADESNRWTPENALQPPADLDYLAGLTQVSRFRRPCIEATTVNTVGLGLEVVPREGMEDDVVDEDETRKVQSTVDALCRQDVRLGRPNAKRLFSAVKWDEEEVGNGYIEVSRNRLTGEIDGLFHAIGKRVRRRKDRDGWVVGPRDGALGERVEFYNFGEKVQYTDDGKPTATLKDSGRRWDRNELIALQLYSSESRDYGLPRDTHLAVDYLGDRKAAEANVGFFGSSGVPPTVIFVQGEVEDAQGGKAKVTVSDRTVKAIGDTLRADGTERHRVAIIPVPAGTKTEAHDLAVLSDRDVGFIEYRRDNRRATLGAWRMAPILVADIEDTNYSTAEVELRVTKRQLFDIEQSRWVDILSETILRDLGFGHLAFKFTEMEVESEAVRRTSANNAADRGAIRYGEYRGAQGWPPLPEADQGADPEPGQVEAGWNDKLMPGRSAAPQVNLTDPAAAGDLGNPLIKITAEDLRSDFRASVEDAIARVGELTANELAPVVVEKDGDRIVISPYAANGAG